MVRTQPFYPLFLKNLHGIKKNKMLSLHIFLENQHGNQENTMLSLHILRSFPTVKSSR